MGSSPSSITESVIVDVRQIDDDSANTTLLRRVNELESRLLQLETSRSPEGSAAAPIARRSSAPPRVIVKPNWHGDLLRELSERRKKIQSEE